MIDVLYIHCNMIYLTSTQYIHIYAGLITFHPVSDNLVEVSALVYVSVCMCAFVLIRSMSQG